MSRYSQLIWIMVDEKMPTQQEIHHHWTALDVTEDVKKIRATFRRSVRSKNIPEAKLWRAAEYFLTNGTLDGFMSDNVLLFGTPAHL